MKLHSLAGAACLLAALFVYADALAVMSIDFGNEFMKIAIVKPGVPMEIALNEESQRKTNTIVSFRNGERLFGAPALATSVKYPKSAYWFMRDLLGKTLDSHQVEVFREKFPYYDMAMNEEEQLVFKDSSEQQFTPEELIGMILQKAKIIAEKFAEQPISEVVVTVPPYLNQAERRAMFRAVEMSGLKVLQLMNDNAAVALNYGVFRRKEFNSTAVHYMFFDMGATKTTATVVSYQLVKTKNAVTGITETNPQLTIKGVGYDRNLGGLDFQLRLRDHLAKAFNSLKKTSEDVTKNDRAMAKLLKEAERVKKVLSSNKDHYAQVESLIDDQDFKVKVTREEYEELGRDIFDRVAKPVEDAIKSSEVTWEEINEIILMGGFTRTPLVQDILRKISGKSDLGKSINTDEAAALGAVYQAAHLSKGFKVKNFHVKDMTLFPIQVEFERVRTGEEVTDPSQAVKRTLFGFKNPYPQKKVMTFNKHTTDFKVDVKYGDLTHLSSQQKKEFGVEHIQQVSIEGVEAAFSKNTESESKGVKAHFRVDESGLFSLDKAEVVFEKNATQEETKVEQSTLSKLGNYFFGSDEADKEATVEEGKQEEKNEQEENEGKEEEKEEKEGAEKKEEGKEEKGPEQEGTKEKEPEQKDEAKTEPEQKDEKPDSKTVEDEEVIEEKSEKSEKSEKESKEKDPKEGKKDKENDGEKKEDKDSKDPKEDPKEDEKKKPKNVTVKELLTSSIKIVDKKDPSEESTAASKNKIDELTRKDKAKQALAKAKNDLETFLVDMQDKLWQDRWEKASTEGERTEIREKLSAASDWLYEQEDDTDKSVYQNKLKELKALTKDLNDRVKEHEERPRALEALNSMVNYSEQFLKGMKNFTGENQPFTEVELTTLEKLIIDVKTWNASMTSEQIGQPLTERPKLLIEDVARKMSDLDREVKYLINKAKTFKPKVVKVEKNKTEEAKTKTNETDSETSKKTDDKTGDKKEEKVKKKRPKQKRDQEKSDKQKQEKIDDEEKLQLDEKPDSDPESVTHDRTEL